MAVTFRTKNDATGDGNAAGTQNLPASTAADDLLTVHLAFEKGTDITVTNNGWTIAHATNGRANQGTNIGAYFGWRLATTIDVIAGNVLRPSLSTTAKWSSTISRWDGHDAATPINASGTPASNTSGNPDPPSVTSTVDGCLLVALCAAKSQTTYTAPSGYTERWDNPNSTSGTPGLSGASKAQVSAGADNPATFTPGSASEWVAQTFAIAASGGVATPIPFLVTARQAI